MELSTELYRLFPLLWIHSCKIPINICCFHNKFTNFTVIKNCLNGKTAKSNKIYDHTRGRRSYVTVVRLIIVSIVYNSINKLYDNDFRIDY